MFWMTSGSIKESCFMAKILIVDDDTELRDAVSHMLGSLGFIVDPASNTIEAEDLLDGFTYDLIVLDWVLPDSTGIELLRKIRLAGKHIPLIMLTGKNSLKDKMDGLEGGADDYLTKPFHMKELVARINAVLRRPPTIQDGSISLSGITLDAREKCVRHGTETVSVTRQEFLLLEFLMKNPGQVFSQEALVERAWTSLSESSPDTVRVHMSRLRKKLKQYVEDCPIKTVHGLGYRFVVKQE